MFSHAISSNPNKVPYARLGNLYRRYLRILRPSFRLASGEWLYYAGTYDHT